MSKRPIAVNAHEYTLNSSTSGLSERNSWSLLAGSSGRQPRGVAARDATQATECLKLSSVAQVSWDRKGMRGVVNEWGKMGESHLNMRVTVTMDWLCIIQGHIKGTLVHVLHNYLNTDENQGEKGGQFSGKYSKLFFFFGCVEQKQL